MKLLVCCLVLALTTNIISPQSCPQDPRVGNPINYVHLFKEQNDLNWDFYNTKTTYTLVYMEKKTLLANTYRNRIVFRLIDNNLPSRQWLYLIDIRYDANEFILQIDKFAKIRSDGVPANDLAIVRAFFNDATIVLPIPGNCCLAKLEYINFYYLFANYYKDGSGIEKPACT